MCIRTSLCSSLHSAPFWKVRMPCMQAAAKAQAEAEMRHKEEMSRRRSRLQASMAEVTGPRDRVALRAVVQLHVVHT